MAETLIEKNPQGIPDTPEIKAQCETIRNLGRQSQVAKIQLETLIAEAQAKCEHDFQKVRRFEIDHDDPFYDTYNRVILHGWRCKKCFLFKPRPKDTGYFKGDYRFCKQCCGEMHFVEELCVEGSNRHIFLYACSQCGYEQAQENTG